MKKALRGIFGYYFIFLDEIIFTKEQGGAQMTVHMDEENRSCKYTLVYPVSLIQDPHREFVISHELVHLIRDHLLERLVFEYTVATTPRNVTALLPYLRAQEVEADVYTFLFNLENPQHLSKFFEALLPWDSFLFRFLYKKGYHSLSKFFELLNTFGRKYIYVRRLMDHPTLVTRIKWARRWQRLFKAEESLPDTQRTKVILPKELNKRIRFLSKL